MTGLWIGLAFVGGGAFWLCRPHSRTPLREVVVPQSRVTAIAEAAAVVHHEIGIDTRDWDSFAAPSADTSLLEHAHHLRQVDDVLPLAARKGLVYSWRVRFANGRDTVAVGLDRDGSLTFLDLRGERADHLRSLVDAGAPCDVLERIESSPALEVVTRTERAAGRTLRVETSGELTQIEALAGVQRTRARAAATQRAAMHATALIMVAGVVVLLLGRTPPTTGSLSIGALLAAVVWFTVWPLEGRMWEESAVLGLDVNQPLHDQRRRHRATLAGAATVNALSVLLAVTVGGTLWSELSGPSHPWPEAALAGATVGIVWVGASAVLYATGRRAGALTTMPEPSPAAVRRCGHSWSQVVVMSVQSSIGEEAIHRLLAISLVWHLTGSAALGIATSALLWAATHLMEDVAPRRVRLVELVVIGVVLGLLFVTMGPVAAVAAHFTANMLVLGWPLLAEPSARRLPVAEHSDA